MKTIVCFGPGPAFKGGISNYNTSLAKALDNEPNTKVHIVSWTQQYPAIIPRDFKDNISKSDMLDNTNISVEYITNYNNPFSWYKTYQYIQSLSPDIVIFQWAIAIQGLPIGRIAHWLQKNTKAEIIMDLHFVQQKENSTIDQFFTKIGISKSHTYIVHAMKTYEELKALYPTKDFHLSFDGRRGHQTVLKLYHPIYSLFQPKAAFDVAAFKQQHGLKKHVFLFFGFIRKYKGLHQVIEAFDLVRKQRNDVSLLICGEQFWNTLDNSKWSTKIKKAIFGFAKKLFLSNADDESAYKPLDLIEALDLGKETVVFDTFIPNEEVHQYFQVADNVILFYLTATPSGIESLSYNFKLPILATAVGHFPETITHGFNGYLAENGNINDMASIMLQSIDYPIDRNNIFEKTKEMSWENYAEAILMN